MPSSEKLPKIGKPKDSREVQLLRQTDQAILALQGPGYLENTNASHISVPRDLLITLRGLRESIGKFLDTK